MSESRKKRQTESVHTAGLHMTEVGSRGRMRQDLLLDGDSSFGVKLQLQPSVSAWSRAHRHTQNQRLVRVSNRHTGILIFHVYL